MAETVNSNSTSKRTSKDEDLFSVDIRSRSYKVHNSLFKEVKGDKEWEDYLSIMLQSCFGRSSFTVTVSSVSNETDIYIAIVQKVFQKGNSCSDIFFYC